MAEYGIDMAHGPPGEEVSPGRSVAALAQWGGALVSLALIVGLVVWGYRIAVRDVSGVPVIQALDTPMRVAPSDPGGNLAENQGLAVNQVAGEGMASGPAESVTLAPRPAGLAEEDVALGLLDDFATSEPDGPLLRAEPDDAAAIAPQPSGAQRDAGIQALIGQLADPSVAPAVPGTGSDTQSVLDRLGAVDLPEADFEPQAPSVWEGVTAPDTAPAANAGRDTALERLTTDRVPGAGIATATARAVPVSLRPVPRDAPAAPDAEADAPAQSVSVAREMVEDPIMAAIRESAALSSISPTPSSATDGVAEIDPATLPSGTRLVQIGAFDSASIARAQWDRLVPRFGAYLDDKARVIQRATSGGRVFYRLRAHGFVDLADARRFCAAFKAGGVDCIPVTVR